MSDVPFDLDAVFEVDDYVYFYSESLTDESASMAIVARKAA